MYSIERHSIPACTHTITLTNTYTLTHAHIHTHTRIYMYVHVLLFKYTDKPDYGSLCTPHQHAHTN